MGIKLVNVSCSYRSGRHSFPVFYQANFIFPDRGLICILGKSGSGKTTLLDLLAGFLKPNRGKIINPKNQNFAFVFQDGELIDSLSVRDNVCLGLTLVGQKRKQRENNVEPLVKKVKVEHLLNKEANDISGGEKIRAALVRALAIEKAVILADEPTGALDSVNARAVMDLLREEGRKRLVICVTHNEFLAQTYADYSAEVSHGKITWRDKPENLATHEEPSMHKPRKKILDIFDAFRLSVQMLKHKKGRLLLASMTIGFAFAALTQTVAVGVNAKKEAARLTDSYYANDVVYLAETVTVKQGQGMKLTRKEELSSRARKEAEKFGAKLYPSLAFFLPRTANWYKGAEKFDISFEPSFTNGILATGHWPAVDGECIANKTLCLAIAKEPTEVIGLVIPLEVQQEIVLTIAGEEIKGVFTKRWLFKVVGIADEESIFNYPTLYYPYLSVFGELKDVLVKENNALTLGDILTEDEFKNTEARSYETLALTADSPKIQAHFKNKPSLKVAVISKALAGKESIDGIITAVANIVTIFLSLAAIVSFFLELVCIASICLENRRNYAVIMAFATRKAAFKRFVWGLVNVFAICSTFFFTVFAWGMKFGAAKILGNLGLGAAIGNISFGLLFLFLLGMYALAALAAFLPLRSLTKAKLALSLRSEK